MMIVYKLWPPECSKGKCGQGKHPAITIAHLEQFMSRRAKNDKNVTW